VKTPVLTPSREAALLGDVGDEPPPQAVNNVASVATEATWQAPPQNSRREMGADVSGIAQCDGKIEADRKWAGFSGQRRLIAPADHELACGRVIS
jgi:hypothetical protein